jgi:hypothetical protein
VVMWNTCGKPPNTCGKLITVLVENFQYEYKISFVVLISIRLMFVIHNTSLYQFVIHNTSLYQFVIHNTSLYQLVILDSIRICLYYITTI